MAYNHGREDRKWRIWKEAEEKVLRECGVDEAVIEQIRTDDRADFNSNRRFYRWTSDFGEYLEGMADREKQAEVKSVSIYWTRLRAKLCTLPCHGGQAHVTNRPAENAGIFHKGDCPACAFNGRGYLCKVKPFAKEAAENFISA